MKKLIIPNAITLLNILSGTFSVYFALSNPEKLYIAGFLILIASVFDFFDGFTARILNAQSEFGKQLDSLSDLISFGLAPTFIMFSLIENLSENKIIPFLSFIIIAFSAIRLAIFNITDQKTEFKGLPTPAFALLIASIAISNYFNNSPIKIDITNLSKYIYILIVITIIFSFLLVSKIRMFSLKFSNFSFSKNKLRYSFILFSVLLLILFYWSAIPLIITFYILISIFYNFRRLKDEKK